MKLKHRNLLLAVRARRGLRRKHAHWIRRIVISVSRVSSLFRCLWIFLLKPCADWMDTGPATSASFDSRLVNLSGRNEDKWTERGNDSKFGALRAVTTIRSDSARSYAKWKRACRLVGSLNLHGDWDQKGFDRSIIYPVNFLIAAGVSSLALCL